MKEILLIFVLFLVLLSACSNNSLLTDKLPVDVDCNSDKDCVPMGCCHSASCVATKFAPNCEGIMCTQECVPNTLDCGQGNCVCVNHKCGISLQQY